MQNARDKEWGGVKNFEMALQVLEGGRRTLRRGPEKGIVVGEKGEEDAQEE